MPVIPAPPLPLRHLGRAAHDIGLAGLLGGNLFGRFALHPAVTEITDVRERGKVVNAAWRRYGTINSLSVLAVTSGWVGARLNEAAPSRLSPEERRLALAKDALVGLVAACGIAMGAEGMRFAKAAPDGAVPLEDGDHAAPSASEEAQKLKRRVNRLGALTMAAEVGLVAVNSALSQRNFRRPPMRRALRARRRPR